MACWHRLNIKTITKSYMHILFIATYWLRFWANLQRCNEEEESIDLACCTVEITVIQIFANFQWRFSNSIFVWIRCITSFACGVITYILFHFMVATFLGFKPKICNSWLLFPLEHKFCLIPDYDWSPRLGSEVGTYAWSTCTSLG